MAITEERNSRERDLVLLNGESSIIADLSKGTLNLYTGNYKASLSQTDQPVFFNKNTNKLEYCSLEQSKTQFVQLKQGQYCVLENPHKNNDFPKHSTVSSALLSDLDMGKKINIAGPSSFPLWPCQTATVIEGHKLKSNQFLKVRTYDIEKIKENLNENAIEKNFLNLEDIKTGKEFLIKGTDVSFYIPPTGIEVVKDSSGEYIRNAVTLERLEYCILLDENGNKRFEKGPAVVFPTSTETFIERDESPKLKAVELNDVKAIYVKVIAPYVENGIEFEEGQELLITGKDQKFYFPRAEHAIINMVKMKFNLL